jgi:Amt family ammonium transporter
VSIAPKIYRYFGLFIAGIILFWLTPALAQATTNPRLNYLEVLWLTIAASLVFFMNAGFAMLEAGLCQTRNAVNVLAKNLIVFCISLLAFWALGFGLMFGNGNSVSGLTGFCFQALNSPFNNAFPAGFSQLESIYPQQSFIAVFFFQLVFAGTTATIVSGAVAERVKFWAFFAFSFCLVAIAYPLTGHWVWGVEGWLKNNFNFLDFAGSTVVHSVGGMAGLVGAFLLGPRRGWQGYNPDRTDGDKFGDTPKNFGYYDLTFSTLGCFILWLGWLGFNGGSVRDISHIPHVIVTTMMAAATGGVFTLFFRGLRPNKITLVSVINGILGGLVGITASSAYVNLLAAIFIGAISSLCVFIGDSLLKHWQIDDPVGAIPVHLGCGIWGTFAAGLFAEQLPPYIDSPIIRGAQIANQILGILVVNGTILLFSLLFWLAIGLIIYGTELLDEAIKPHQERDRGYRYQSEMISPDSLGKIISKYLQIAREALRVSAIEESQGSDGTFDRR